MNNAEKYQEVFGFPPDKGNCPADNCNVCPCASKKDSKGYILCPVRGVYEWWDEEYKGGAE